MDRLLWCKTCCGPTWHEETRRLYDPTKKDERLRCRVCGTGREPAPG